MIERDAFAGGEEVGGSGGGREVGGSGGEEVGGRGGGRLFSTLFKSGLR